MSEGIVAKQQRKGAVGSCRHRWVIETPHGATSRGMCKHCGTTKRFPNAAEDAIWESGRGNLRRWAGRRGVARPAKISLPDSVDTEA